MSAVLSGIDETPGATPVPERKVDLILFPAAVFTGLGKNY
jgi:hypothetical protein